MALANVGLELVRRGRRVLLVDFDLEAPGLDTFPLLRPKAPTKGIVDFVTEYLVTGVSPDVTDFVYKAELPATIPGSIMVMPTGLPGDEYGSRLNNIDWQRLYSERDGFLLFEDLKAQWKQSVRPDYVLIDSRTGHTDVGGICTRQLPDAVTLLFFPNEQNERGMQTVVEDIRAEITRTGREIALYFVASNVPELDDEDKILFQRIRHFRQTLKCAETEIIHHYDSLALLEQKIFTVERPKSKLALEYRRLTQRAVSDNYEDRDVAMRYIDRLRRSEGFRDGYSGIEDSLKRIGALYQQDGEVLYSLARANRSLGRDEAANALIAEAQKLGYETVDTLVAKAVPAYESGQTALARQLIERALDVPRGGLFDLGKVVKAVVNYDPPHLRRLVQALCASSRDPEERLYLAKQMMSSLEGISAAEALLRQVLEDNSADADDQEDAATDLVLTLISQGRFQEAMACISNDRMVMMHRAVADTFNYAIAEWGATGVIPQDLFSRVLEFQETRGDANFSQCLALAFWANGDIDNARRQATEALKKLSDSAPIFSCWQYLIVESKVFQDDIASLIALIETNAGVPAVIARAKK
jgi:MinD-like ATPase involved in chromosome partitioning or flagellar assembly